MTNAFPLFNYQGTFNIGRKRPELFNYIKENCKYKDKNFVNLITNVREANVSQLYYYFDS